MNKMFLAAIGVVPFILSPAMAQDATSTQPVTRQEFDELRKDNADLRKEVTSLKQQQTEQATNAEQDAKDNDAALKAINHDIKEQHFGLENVLIAGDAAVGFSAVRGSPSTFSAGVSPLILWVPTDRILIESAFSFSTATDGDNNSSTSVDLGLANISFILCDYAAIGAGQFTSPFGAYHNHFDPPWINKLPDDPLVWSDGIGPTTDTGVYLRGAIPISSTKVTYDIYGSNGPNLVTNPASGNVGSLNFDDFSDLNNNKAFGGRIGFLPFPSLEVGYSAQTSSANPQGFQNVPVFLQAFDLNFKKEIDPIGGTLQFQTQWVFSNAGTATYDPDGSLGVGPLTFKNHRNGGYVELNYRPTESNNEIIRSIEFCSRYDWVFQPLAAPGGGNEQRLTLGIDYWITPYIVLQNAYEFDKRQDATGQNAFLMQLGIGL